VFPIPDAIYGERVGAVVVVAQGESVAPEEILDYSRNQLSPFELPDRLDVVATLPHSAKGALDRRALEDQFANRRRGAGRT
jgi:acyl-CoA synthetase (AMP-forming)/AMP-acid ligase II